MEETRYELDFLSDQTTEWDYIDSIYLRNEKSLWAVTFCAENWERLQWLGPWRTTTSWIEADGGREPVISPSFSSLHKFRLVSSWETSVFLTCLLPYFICQLINLSNYMTINYKKGNTCSHSLLHFVRDGPQTAMPWSIVFFVLAC